MDSLTIATEIVRKLNEAGHTAYFAGGWVRDYLLDHPSEDIDIATDAPPQKILDLFPQTLLIGLAFGIVIILVGNKQFEVATFRKEGPYLNGRKPESVELSDPIEDAKRRDFTINGMFYDPLKGVIYDYVNGREDLKKGIIRTIGNPFERFYEDRLRMVRAVRFAARFGFHIDLETQEAITENADTLYPSVAVERVWHELQKMAKGPRFSNALLDMHRFGLLPVIFPVLKEVPLHEMKERIHHFPVLPEKYPLILYLAELFPNGSVQELIDIANSLKTSKRDIESIEWMAESKFLIAKEQHSPSQIDPVEWAHYYANPLSDLCLQGIAAHYSEEERKKFLKKHSERKRFLLTHIERIEKKKPLVQSAHLVREGIRPGKEMGMLLKEAERIAVNKNINDAETVVRLLKATTLWPSIGPSC